MSGRHVLVMAKSPEPGRSKTRLVPPLTYAGAAEVATAALADTLDAVASCGAGRRLLALDGPPGAWIPPGFEVFAQEGETFNDRLAAAWARADGPGIQIGMDTPQVTPALLDQCLASLGRDGSSAALGLAEDGGWWAIGLLGPEPTAFRGVAMSTSETGRAQLRRLEALGHRVALWPTLRDIDLAEDGHAVADAAPWTRFAATWNRLAHRAVGLPA